MVRVASPTEPGPPGRTRAAGSTPSVGFREALRFWARLGRVNFGGPAGQIALMHRELVERRGWVTEGQFLRALNFCMILPGPEAQQLATYIGWRLHGTRGGLAAGALFVLPSVFVLLLLSWLVAVHSDVPAIAGLLYGVRPVVMAIVAEAVVRIGRRTLHNGALVGIAAAAFVAIFFLSVPFPLIIAAAALAGNRRLQAALAGVTSAVVGVILNLAVFFGRHVLLPSGGALDGFALLLAAVCFYSLVRHDVPVQYLVPAGALAGMAWRLL